MSIPIPARPSGYRLGKPDAPVQIEMFFDLECPFSKKGWQTLMEVRSAYDETEIYLILQPMVLGNHRQSWDATKAAIAIAGNDAEKFVSFVSYLFDFAKRNLPTKLQKILLRHNGRVSSQTTPSMQQSGRTRISLSSF